MTEVNPEEFGNVNTVNNNITSENNNQVQPIQQPQTQTNVPTQAFVSPDKTSVYDIEKPCWFKQHKKHIIIAAIILIVLIIIFVFLKKENFISFPMLGGSGSNSVVKKDGRLFSKTVVKDNEGNVVFEDMSSPVSSIVIGQQQQIPISEAQMKPELQKQQQTMDANFDVQTEFSGIDIK